MLFGSWIDPWSGQPTPQNAPDTQIDHLVSLSDAHTSGAWQWAATTKSAFSNDELNLNATDGAINGAKSNNTADKWQPPLRAARCGFAIDYARVKLRWKLSVTTAEKQALISMVDSCSEPWSNGPRSETSGVQPGQPDREIAEIPPASPSTSEPPSAASTTVSFCLAQDERVGLHNQSASTIDLSGWILHDFERRNEISLPSYILQPGETVVVKSGPTHESGPGIDWTGRHVWNNDGDTAFLIPAGTSEPLAGVVCSQTR